MRNTIHHTNQKESIPINVSVKDNYGNVVASGNYTTAGTYNLSFTPASAGANYTLEFHMTKASAFCFFRVDDVLVSYEDTTTVTVCKEVEDGYRYGYGGHEKLDEVSGSGNTVDMGDRWLDTRLGRTPKIDAKGGKYPFVSPYAYALNNPIIYNDPDGKDVYLVIYTTKEGDVGHAAIAVENYKKVETKVIENGQEITKTEWVKDGTLTYYELGPASPLNGAKDAFKNVEALYGEFNVTLDNVINDPISRYESSAPDGIIKFETSAETDLAIHEKLKSKTNEPYNATGNNCSDYAGCGADMASSDGKVKRKEFLIFPIRSSTPNKLFQNAKKASNATVIQDAGKQANKKFRKAYKGPTESSEPSTPVPDEE